MGVVGSATWELLLLLSKALIFAGKKPVKQSVQPWFGSLRSSESSPEL